MYRPLVVVATGGHDGHIHGELAAQFHQAFDPAVNYAISIQRKLRPVDHARNVAVQMFMQTDRTHLMFVDADVVIPSNVFLLLEGNPTVCAGLVPTFAKAPVEGNSIPAVYPEKLQGGEFQQITWDHVQRWPQDRIEVAGVGAACTVYRRDVIERTQQLYGSVFHTVMTPQGLWELGEDLGACNLFAAQRFPIYADRRVLCDHWASVRLGPPQTLREQYAPVEQG